MLDADDKIDRLISSVQDLRVSMASMGGKLDGYMSRVEAHDNRAEDHEKRLRTVERRLYALPGIGVVFGGAGLGVATYTALK